MRRSTYLLGIVLAVLVLGSLVPGAAQSTPALEGPPALQSTGDDVNDATLYDTHEGEEGEEEEDETGAQLISEWWGLGGEADEAPYMGLVEFGVAVLAIGMLGYSVGKRTSVVPLQYRLRLLQAHQLTMLAGTALVLPHFVAVEEWEGLGLLVGVLLGIEILSGVYGRYLHRHVIRFGRGGEMAPVVGRFVEVTKRSLLSRWRRIHVLLTFVTALVLVLHIVTAVGD